MLKTRVIPTLLINNDSIVKTIQFKNPKYIGDPINTCKIFNELEVDELCILDINATKNNQVPNFKLLEELSRECFMPLSYGGGIKDFETAEKIFKIGYEKIIINNELFSNKYLIKKLVENYGSQAIIASIDIKKTLLKGYQIFHYKENKFDKLTIKERLNQIVEFGIGELLIQNIDREGTWKGFDNKLNQLICDSISIPVIVSGGAYSIDDIEKAVKVGKASAVALGSMVVYQKKDMGVLINFPNKTVLEKALI
jgi:cyclase